MKVHVVTGTGSGIGAVLAERLDARGDRVIRVTRDVVDLADAEAVRRWGSALGEPRLDSVCHVAGTVELGAVADLDLAAWQRQLAVNLTAPAVLTSALLPALRAAGGTVVLVNSMAGLRTRGEWAAYSSSKYGLRGFAEALRDEEPAIRVTTVYPSRTATPMQQKVHVQEGRAYDAERWIRPETVADAIVGVLDLPVDATVTDVQIQPR